MNSAPQRLVFCCALIIALIGCTHSDDDPIIFVRNHSIWLTTPDGSSQQQLTYGQDAQPILSMDRQRIAFVTVRDEQQDIYMIQIDGQQLTRITTQRDLDYDPAFAADAERIVYCTNRDGPYQIWWAAIDGSQHQVLASKSNYERYPSVSPDGMRLAFSRRCEGIFVLNLSTFIEVQLIDCDSLGLWDEIRHMCWSPEGDKLAFYAEDGSTTSLFVVDVASEEVSRVANNTTLYHHIAWHRDGRHILVSQVDEDCTTVNVVLVDALSTETQCLTDGFSPCYSPGWNRIAFCRMDEDAKAVNLLVMDCDGSNVRRIADNAWQPAW